MGLLQTLCLVKMDTVDGKKPSSAARKPDEVKTNAAESASCNHPNSATDNKVETEMKGGYRAA